MRYWSLVAIAAMALSISAPAIAEQAAHRLAIHVDDADPAKMNLALNNAQNVKAYYDAKGEKTEIEVVAYGPGLSMLTADSPVKDRISAMALENPQMQFSACGNTMAAIEKKTGTKVALLGEAKVVSAGVVRLMELQEAGWSYIRP
jgi:intracellular sulfur oxidation DsrE/DsrF family protein